MKLLLFRLLPEGLRKILTTPHHAWRQLLFAVNTVLFSERQPSYPIAHSFNPLIGQRSVRLSTRDINNFTWEEFLALLVFIKWMHSATVYRALIRMTSVFEVVGARHMPNPRERYGRQISVACVTLMAMAGSTNCNCYIFESVIDPCWIRTVDHTFKHHPLFFELFVNCLLETRKHGPTTWNGCRRIMQKFNRKEYFLRLGLKSRLVFLAALPFPCHLFVHTKSLLETVEEAVSTLQSDRSVCSVLNRYFPLEFQYFRMKEKSTSFTGQHNPLQTTSKELIDSVTARQLQNFTQRCFAQEPDSMPGYTLDDFVQDSVLWRNQTNTMPEFLSLSKAPFLDRLHGQHLLPSLAFLICSCHSTSFSESIAGDFYSVYLQPETDFNFEEIKDTWQRVLHWLDILETIPGRASTVANQVKLLVEMSLLETGE